MSQNLDVRDFGAAGDGQTNDTAAFRRALEAAGKTTGTVFVPEGTFLTGQLRLPPHTGLVGNATWGYRSTGGSTLRLNDPEAGCLLDITGAVGATIHGLTLHGGELGSGIHGIGMEPLAGKKEEDAPRIERCHLSHFTGDGIHLGQVWCFSIRSCEVIFNRGHGLYVKGWDGFILDNWFSGNQGCGYCADEANASVTMTGNRIEWNHSGGIRILGGSHYNITGNYIDRSGGPGIHIGGRDGAPSFCLTVTGNVIYRSGKPEWTEGKLPSAHAVLEEAHGLVFTGNSMCTGQDDNGGQMSPRVALQVRALQNSLVKDNAMHVGAIEELVRDLGGHREGVVVADNVGSLFVVKPGENLWSSGQV